MSVFHGPCGKGAAKRHAADKRSQAEERDARLGVHDGRRRAVRLAAERLQDKP